MKKDIYGRKTYPENPCPECGGIEYPHSHSAPPVTESIANANQISSKLAVTESEVCENPNCYCGAPKHKCECKQGASDMCKYCHLPPEEKDLVEDWEKELLEWGRELDDIMHKREKWEDIYDSMFVYRDTIRSDRNIKRLIKSIVSSNTERVKRDLFRKIKDYDFKENHNCAYNDGEQDCECFIQGLNVALNYINSIK